MPREYRSALLKQPCINVPKFEEAADWGWYAGEAIPLSMSKASAAAEDLNALKEFEAKAGTWSFTHA